MRNSAEQTAVETVSGRGAASTAPRLDGTAVPHSELPQRVRRSGRWRRIGAALLLIAVAGAIGLTTRQFLRYRTSDEMVLPLQEYSNAEYPEDPANRSKQFGSYHGRRLRLIRRDEVHFDFIVESDHDHIATVRFLNVDVSLMTPSLPAWCRGHAGNARISLTDRQWNRQQVSFEVDGETVQVSGGDGFERSQLASAELAKNCLNAGLWEVLLFTQGASGKELYYQGWFTFPLGHYRRLFEKNTGYRYFDHWYYLEHWFDPAGTVVDLDSLRSVVEQVPVKVTWDPQEAILVAGEQQRKKRTVLGRNLRQWRDFDAATDVSFAAFIPPGRYSVAKPWHHEYERIAQLESATLSTVMPAGQSDPAQELELKFRGRDGEICRFLVSGFRWDELDQLPDEKYSDGLYMPMGIGVPPFFQSYDALRAHSPEASPWFSVLLDEQNRWIDHHRAAIDGLVLHRDAEDPDRLHVHLLSYERHSLIRHFVVTRLAASAAPSVAVSATPDH